MNTTEGHARGPKPLRKATAICFFFGMAAIVGWSLPESDPPGEHAELAADLPDGGGPVTADQHSTPVPATHNARSKLNCDGCGVIESVRRIDTREEIMRGCAVSDTVGTSLPGNLIDGSDRIEVPTLADTVAGVIVGDHPARKVRVTTRHQIVVRFRDGSRHVFDEDTPRTLREGDRIKVIAGSTRLNG